jgi:hypothetical protein
MKSAVMPSMAMMKAVLAASEADPKMLRLIGPDAKAIYGVDVERYRQSMLASFFPLDESAEIDQLMAVVYGDFDLQTRTDCLSRSAAPARAGARLGDARRDDGDYGGRRRSAGGDKPVANGEGRQRRNDGERAAAQRFLR